MRNCSRCGIDKDESEFEVRKNRKTGFNGVCKTCVNIRRKEAKKKNPELYKKTAKRCYEKNREERVKKQSIWQKENYSKVLLSHAKWREKNREWINERNRLRISPEQRKKWSNNWKKRDGYAQKHRAQSLINMHLSKGKIIKPDKCQFCNRKSKVDGHHSDYSKPLEVIWLCRPCHSALHKRLKKES